MAPAYLQPAQGSAFRFPPNSQKMTNILGCLFVFGIDKICQEGCLSVSRWQLYDTVDTVDSVDTVDNPYNSTIFTIFTMYTMLTLLIETIKAIVYVDSL